jgi:hypothetical protein
MSLSGSGTRKFLLGTGTFTFTGTGGNLYTLATTTNLDGTSNFGATFVMSPGGNFCSTFDGGGRTYGPITINANANRRCFIMVGSNTFNSFSIAAGVSILFAANSTTTTTNAFTWTGTSSIPHQRNGACSQRRFRNQHVHLVRYL